MKAIKFVIIMIALVVGINASAQKQVNQKKSNVTTVNIKVRGNCDMCKSRIEKAAQVNGVTKATWNSNTEALTLAYNPAVVSSDNVQKKIAAVGHDTEKFKAPDKVYNNLPGCCQYDRKK